MKNWLKAFSLLLIGVFSSSVLADQVTLKNGDRVTGTVVKSDGKSLVVKSDLFGEITIGLENVSSIVSDKPLYVGLADGRTVVGLVTAENDKADIKSSGGPDQCLRCLNLNFDTSVVTDITKRIGWQLTLSDRYLSNPPFGLKQNDLILTTGVRLKLGNLK